MAAAGPLAPEWRDGKGSGGETGHICRPVSRRSALLRYDLESAEEVVASYPKVDAVHINTPIQFHAEHTLMALRAGKHVACTVPMATSGFQHKMYVALNSQPLPTHHPFRHLLPM